MSASVAHGPSVDRVTARFAEPFNFNRYPFYLPVIKSLEEIVFPQQVTFFVGENSMGKSTFLEALAYKAGFGYKGGRKNIHSSFTKQRKSTSSQEQSSLICLGHL